MIDIFDLFNACLYIQDNLDADLSLMFLAQTVGLSRFRFHRVFKAWRGETLHDFVTRMRMERAAFELRYPIPRSSRRSIKAIAFASGYKSLSSFSHAFSAYSQLSPRAYRNHALRCKADVACSDAADRGFAPFTLDVSLQPERQVAVLDTATLSSERPDIGALARSSVASPIGGDRYGVELLPNLLARSLGQSSQSLKASRLGCVGVDVDDWLEASRGPARQRPVPRSCIRLDAGRYAVISGRGSLASLYRVWRRGFDDWLVASGECPKPGRLFIRFTQSDSRDEPQAKLALFIPLEDLPPALATARRSRAGTLDAAPRSGTMQAGPSSPGAFSERANRPVLRK